MKRVGSLLTLTVVSLFLLSSVVSADVTVTSANGDVITFTDEEIGSIAASGEKPFAGKEISIQ